MKKKLKQTNLKKKDTFFYILIRSWRNWTNFDRCIDSVFSQKYTNYKIIFIDDNSGYNTSQKKYISKKLIHHNVVFNRSRKYSVRNAYEAIHNFCKKNDAVIVNLDGDDYFCNDSALNIINSAYQNPDCYFTYGNCCISNSGQLIPSHKVDSLNNSNYPEEIIKKKLFRLLPFRVLHPRTWLVSIFKTIPKPYFFKDKKTWFRYCEDMLIFFYFFEHFSRNYKVISSILTIYNSDLSTNETSLNTRDLIIEEILIRKKNNKPPRLENTSVILFHSPVLSLPIINSILYFIQYLLIKKCNFDRIFFSTKNNPYKDKIINIINQKKVNLVCKSLKFGNYLFKFKVCIILDVKEIVIKNTTKDYYDFMWTLVHSSNVTKNTKTSLIQSKMGVVVVSFN